MTDDLIRQLISAGLNKHQATSVTAETLVRLFMKEDGKILIAEAERQVSEMKHIINDLRSDYDSLKSKISNLSDILIGVHDAEDKYGKITDERAQMVVALYGALLAMNEKAGADPSEAVRNTSYVVYAFLGGQAKREISTTQMAPETRAHPLP